MTSAARAPIGFALAIVACLAVYWPGLTAWFLMDDYAWLGLRTEVRGIGDLLNVLFRPQAQGTVRVLSERAFFLIFSSWFGLDALPFKIWIFFTHFANLFLIGAITFRLTRSRLAAAAAPLVWTFHSALLIPLSWVSAYNQVLWAFCLLSGLLSFIRYTETGRARWLAVCWIVYLAGFGVLELNIVFPAVLLLYAVCCARPRWRSALPFFIPAALFTYAHVALVPKQSDPLYRMYFDADLLRTLWTYLSWGFGPTLLDTLGGYIVTALVGSWLLGFSAARLARRNWLPVFLLGWFVLTIAPVLPLKEHKTDYYLTAPTIGFAILAGWAFASAWNWRRSAGFAVAALLLAYGTGMYAQIHSALEWRHTWSLRLRDLLFAVEQSYARQPKPVLLLSGVEHDLYAAGFNDHPFRLVAPVTVYLTPGSEAELKRQNSQLRGVDEYVISEGDAARVLERGEALVLHVAGGRIRNVTTSYSAIARARFRGSEQRRIDVGLPGSEEKLGPTWHPLEQGFRWMPEIATVRLAGPDSPGSRLQVEGFVPAAVVTRGPVVLRVKIDGLLAGFERLSAPDKRFLTSFSVPPQLVGKPAVTVELSVDRTLESPDGRRLGLIFGVLEIKSP